MQLRYHSWRELLGSFDTEERRRIIEALGIQDKTFERWIHGYTNFPHLSRIRQLLAILPAQARACFIECVQQDPHFSKYAADIALPDSRQEIPSTVYARILEANVVTPEALHFITLCQLVLLEMVRQLDREGLGVSVTILTCTPPRPGKQVRTLSQRFSLGTSPWNTIIEQKRFFLGAESIAGQAVIQRCPVVREDYRHLAADESLYSSQDLHTMSSAGVPFERGERVAGCFFVLSTQPSFFTEDCLTLIQHYCHLLAIALNGHEWYERQQIELHVLPPIQAQQDILSQFHEQLALAMKRRSVSGEDTNWLEAEREACQRLEDACIEKA